MRYYDPETKALSSLYDLLSNVADGFPDKNFEAYSKKQRQYIINNLINFLDENMSLLSDEMNEIIYPYPELSFDKLREILKSANKKNMDSTKARYDEWIAFAGRFDNHTKDALVRFIDDCVIFSNIIFSPNSQTGNASFSSGYTNAYRQILHLDNPAFSGNYNTESYETDDAEIDVLDDGYRISFVQAGEMMSVHFTDVHLETQLLNYSDANRWDGSPWAQISESLTALEHKKDILGMTFLNKKEKALWRLSEFSPIHSMVSHWHLQKEKSM